MCELEYIECALCGRNERDLFLKVKNTHGAHFISNEEFNLVKCKNCGLIFVNPRPKQNEIKKFYNNIDYYSSSIQIKTFIEKYLSKYFNFYRRKNIIKYKTCGRLLDIGCGKGEFLSSFASKKWNLYGVEPNELGFNLIDKRIKDKVFNDNLRGCKFPNNYFDIITMWHVLEHLDDPNKELAEINRILKKGGLFILSVPNIEGLGFRLTKNYWFHLDCPRHLYYFTTKTINKIFNKFGFEIFRIVFPSFEYPLDLYHSLYNLFGKNKFLTLPLISLSLMSKPISSLFKISETIIIFCRKGY